MSTRTGKPDVDSLARSALDAPLHVLQIVHCYHTPKCGDSYPTEFFNKGVLFLPVFAGGI